MRPAQADALTVTLPLGSHVAVAVYNTDAVRPQSPATVETTTRIMWLENRTVYAGMAEERQAAIPYYLLKEGNGTPTGSWVVEIKPLVLGKHVVPIICSANMVTVTISGKAQMSHITMSAILTSRSAVPPLARIMLFTAIGLSPGQKPRCDPLVRRLLRSSRFPIEEIHGAV